MFYHTAKRGYAHITSIDLRELLSGTRDFEGDDMADVLSASQHILDAMPDQGQISRLRQVFQARAEGEFDDGRDNRVQVNLQLAHDLDLSLTDEILALLDDEEMEAIGEITETTPQP